MRGSVLITRPQPAANGLRTALALRAIPAIVAPLFTTAALPMALPVRHANNQHTDHQQYDGIVFTSSMAVKLLPLAQLPAGWTNWPCYCVGANTAAQAQRQGWRSIIDAGGDAATLAQLILQQKPRPQQLLHPCGTERRPEPAESLQASGITLTPWEIYTSMAVPVLPDAAKAALIQNGLSIVTFFSPRAAQLFTLLIQAADVAQACTHLTALCLSPQIATAAAGLSWARIVNAASPTQAAMLDSLQILRRQEKMP